MRRPAMHCWRVSQAYGVTTESKVLPIFATAKRSPPPAPAAEAPSLKLFHSLVRQHLLRRPSPSLSYLDEHARNQAPLRSPCYSIN